MLDECRCKQVMAYSRLTPEDGLVPTEIKFNTNLIIQIDSKINEEGKLVTKKEVFGIDVKYYHFIDYCIFRGTLYS